LDPALGTKVLHLRGAFHGRSGYTMSLTNTDPNKVARFPKFDWPRIDAPFTQPNLDDEAMGVLEAESLRQARTAFEANPHDVACFIAEPIQGEGGDRHFRPQFFAAMRELCDEFDALLIFDEVQTGCGVTGTAWAYQQLGTTPDVVAFGKKTQVCGVMAGGRIDEVTDNVFTVSSRINSTWGGNLVDMVRSRRVLEVIEADDLFGRAAQNGRHLRDGLTALADDFPGLVRDVRGRGLMCAFSMPAAAQRDRLIAELWDCGVIMLGSGIDSVRFRPALTVSRSEIDAALDAVRAVLRSMWVQRAV
jgi:L-lysine 6-transaminase